MKCSDLHAVQQEDPSAGCRVFSLLIVSVPVPMLNYLTPPGHVLLSGQLICGDNWKLLPTN